MVHSISARYTSDGGHFSHRYRYTTRKGLSTKALCTFDLELPKGMLPICADGEVECFVLMTIDELRASIVHGGHLSLTYH